MKLDTVEAVQTPKLEISAVRQRTPPLLIPPPSVDSFRSSSKQTSSPSTESDPDICARHSSFMDLGDVPDNEFILLAPSALPHLSINEPLHSQGQLDDFSDFDGMEVEAINYQVESFLVADRTLTRSRSVTLVEESPSSEVTTRFRLPSLRLRPRGWVSSSSREAPWESFNNFTW